MTTPYRWTPFYTPGIKSEIENITFRHMPDMIQFAINRFQKQTAFVQYMPNGMKSAMTYEQVDHLSSAFAIVLREKLKLNVGDRVAIQMPNCLSYPIAAFGILKAGLILVNTNPLYTAPEMNHQFKDSGAKAVIVMDMFADRLPQGIKSTAVEHIILVSIAEFFDLVPKTIITTVLKYIKKQLPPVKVAHLSFSELMDWGQKEFRQRPKNMTDKYLNEITLESIAALQYTGGTTGVSKAAVLTHRNLIANSLQMLEVVKSKFEFGSEVVLTALPMYHIFAFTVNLMAFFFAGAKNYLIPSPRPLTNLKKVLAEIPITWMTGVNTLFNGLCNEAWFKKNPPKNLKMSVAGGMALHKSTNERWHTIVGTGIVEGYGLTEASPVLSVSPIGGQIKDGTVGIPIPSTDMKCMDEDGKEVSLGEAGELCARGPQIMKEYWRQPEETKKVLVNGWLHTGDIATMDAEGYFRIVDRKKDMIIVSGFNVYPNEVEDVIAKYPKVLEVAVIGIPDEQMGESVRAFIHLKDDARKDLKDDATKDLKDDATKDLKDDRGDETAIAEEIREHCKKFLTNYKIPKSIIFKKDLPKTPVGKILRKELRKL